VDAYGTWEDVRDVESSGCVLVRPDQHVAWRAVAATDEALAELPAVLGRVLGQVAVPA
jgi:2,4-dichlorophenol 6-monooxygenase